MMRLIPVNNSYSYHVTRQSTFFPLPLSFWLASVIEACLYQQNSSSQRESSILFSLLDEDYLGVGDYEFSRKGL